MSRLEGHSFRVGGVKRASISFALCYLTSNMHFSSRDIVKVMADFNLASWQRHKANTPHQKQNSLLHQLFSSIMSTWRLLARPPWEDGKQNSVFKSTFSRAASPAFIRGEAVKVVRWQ